MMKYINYLVVNLEIYDMNKYIDLVAIGNLAATLLGYLPALAAAFTIAWYSYKFYQEFRKSK